MTDRTTFVSLAGLRGRGWTDAMVRDLLGEPDVLGRSPRRWSPAPVRLYLVARVQAVERTPEFPREPTASGRGSPAVRVAAERRRAAVLGAIRAEPIRVPRLPGPELERRAVGHRRALGDRGGVKPGALVGWQVSYLMHALSRYEALLDGLFGSTGRAEAERLLRRRLYEAIAAAYPELAGECRRRAERVEGADSGGERR
ncbi:hypothetical protein GCM10014713_52010 [Streptomyces purpureus]|uniref:Uncharacterized protein n=2 Tax=Streptomyces purpureus TaxID=1951 RepID=A0A918LUI9_9ACTN|nr:hypothetical protein GCM10014713_52010 [Streptomyces purpureus]